MLSRHCLRASSEAAAARGLQSNSLAAASAPPLAACEGALDGGCSTGTVASGAGRREARGADDATPSVISTSSWWWECSTTRTMETSKR